MLAMRLRAVIPRRKRVRFLSAKVKKREDNQSSKPRTLASMSTA